MKNRMLKVNINSLIKNEATGETFMVIGHKGLDHIVKSVKNEKRLVLNQLILKKYYKEA